MPIWGCLDLSAPTRTTFLGTTSMKGSTLDTISVLERTILPFRLQKFHLPCIIRSPKLAYLNCILKLLTNFFVRLNFITCWKARGLTSLQLLNLAFNILGLLCKSQLRFVSCDITFTSNKRILID